MTMKNILALRILQWYVLIKARQQLTCMCMQLQRFLIAASPAVYNT